MMSPEEKVMFELMQKSITQMTETLHELGKSKQSEVAFLGGSEGGDLKLEDLESTVKVLRFYKAQGFNKIIL